MKSSKIISIVSCAITAIIFSFAVGANGLFYEDKVVAVVNKEIIKLSDLVKIEDCFINNLAKNNINVPDKFSLRAKLLNQMIDCELIRQESNKMGIFVDNDKLNSVVLDMAHDLKMTLESFKLKIETEESTPWDVYLYNVRNAIYFNSLRQYLIEERINITDIDIDRFLSELDNGDICVENLLKGRKSYKNLYSLSQVLLKISQDSPDKIIDSYCDILREIQMRLRSGENFDDLSEKFSYNDSLSFISFLGNKPLDCWPEVFVEAIADLSVGQVSEIFRTPNGFHIIKILDITPSTNENNDELYKKFNEILIKKSDDLIIQKEVQHILIKSNKMFDENETVNKLEKIRSDILSGDKRFSDMAREYSEDVTASQGGNLGWLSPGAIVRELDSVINNLEPGQVSKVIKSPYGYHLIKVNDSRSKDMFEENKRIRARDYLIELRVQYVFDNWLRNLKKCSFLDNRLMN